MNSLSITLVAENSSTVNLLNKLYKPETNHGTFHLNHGCASIPALVNPSISLQTQALSTKTPKVLPFRNLILGDVQNRLKLLIKTVSSNKELHLNYIINEVQDANETVSAIIKNAATFSLREKMQLTKINRLSVALSLLFRERIVLKESLQKLNELDHSFQPISPDDKTPPPQISHALRKKNMSKDRVEKPSLEGHRLPRQLVLTLQKWYEENVVNPYLYEDTMQALVRETGLTTKQVRNWVSNKRRKEKDFKISSKLTNILY
ncbi:hypothetical protein BABINDRAFT_195845 [Babjeviella inositovora NRRL Y-12698]|uniref:Homeobox domain-containing protein n=1 Tax=Babjeviella inositovora NRRL Y-12698 TaxID=984486 RepID=A0A1E3QS18_9ASCO|nr:uncharacterized protein BABINDRAFT_195845 [Babjeviella inositovora NRRL Y-12698]ODQ80460.1 hypothetical protein BABINDRAFT_195845 [Babjeviella inositovora NRRL Y-12698]